MTSITLANIPNQISTLEQLHAWTSLALRTCNPTIAVLEAPDRSELIVQQAQFQAADNSTRILSRVSAPFDPAFTYDKSKKLWLFAQEISNTSIPAGFLSN